MNEEIENVINPPDAARLVMGMRDMGYSFPSAIADLVDNAIAAKAKNVQVFIEPIFPAKVRVFVGDDGIGMSASELKLAMRYGAPEKEGAKTLNKFGLGLKTASSSFSRKFTVISRPENHGEANRATWDIDQIVAANDWILQRGRATQAQVELLDKVTTRSGTVVLWENIDRLLNEKQSKDERLSKKAIAKYEEEVSWHLSAVFQRYLDPRNSYSHISQINIFVNGVKLKAWDPFCEQETETAILYDKNLDVDLPNGSKGVVRVRGFILPRKERFSSANAASEARINNDGQGIYIYRENRLIHGPDWQELYRSEPHYSLARIDFSFGLDLDDIFEVDVQKSKIKLEADIKDFLQEKVLPQIRSFAQQRYREGQIDGIGRRGSRDLHASANRTLAQVEGEVSEVKLLESNQGTATAKLENKNGQFTVRLLSPSEVKDEQPFVTQQESLRDGVLWEPVISEGRKAVAISVSHPFYNRVYLPTKQKDVVIQSFDYLIWTLAMAEMNTMNDKVKHFYEQMRIDVGRVLRTLSDSLPEADVSEE